MSNKFASKVNIDRKSSTHKDIQKKGSGGRPPVSEKRNKKIFLSLTEREYERVKNMANLEGMAVAVYVRNVLRKCEII